MAAARPPGAAYCRAPSQPGAADAPAIRWSTGTTSARTMLGARSHRRGPLKRRLWRLMRFAYRAISPLRRESPARPAGGGRRPSGELRGRSGRCTANAVETSTRSTTMTCGLRPEHLRLERPRARAGAGRRDVGTRGSATTHDRRAAGVNGTPTPTFFRERPAGGTTARGNRRVRCSRRLITCGAAVGLMDLPVPPPRAPVACARRGPRPA